MSASFQSVTLANPPTDPSQAARLADVLANAVQFYASRSAFPSTGKTGLFYFAVAENAFYTWSGSAYVAGSSPGSGSVWRSGSGAPSNGTGADGDFYLNTANGDVYQRASGTYTVVANIKGPDGSAGASGAGYGGTSTTSLTIGNSGSRTLTTQAGMAYVVGARIRVASGSNWMEGIITAYSGTTMTFTADNSSGTGAFTSWALSIAGQPAATGGFLPTAGGTMDNGAVITFANGTSIRANPDGTGIDIICSAELILRWREGRMWFLASDGTTVRKIVTMLDETPGSSFDNTLGIAVGTIFELRDGTVYVCKDATAGLAVWALKPTLGNFASGWIGGWTSAGGTASTAVQVITATNGISGIDPGGGTWTLGDWTGGPNDVPAPTGWTADYSLYGPSSMAGVVTLTATGTGPRTELSRDVSGLTSISGPWDGSLFSTFTNGSDATPPTGQTQSVVLKPAPTTTANCWIPQIPYMPIGFGYSQGAWNGTIRIGFSFDNTTIAVEVVRFSPGADGPTAIAAQSPVWAEYSGYGNGYPNNAALIARFEPNTDIATDFAGGGQWLYFPLLEDVSGY